MESLNSKQIRDLHNLYEDIYKEEETVVLTHDEYLDIILEDMVDHYCSTKLSVIINEEEVFEIAINAGAKDCINLESIFEIITEKEDFYKVKTELEKKIKTLNYSSIEWRPLNFIHLDKEKSEKLLEILSALEELDDVQNIFTNVNLKNLQ